MSVDRVQQQTAEHVVDDEVREKLTAKGGVTSTAGSGSQTSGPFPQTRMEFAEVVEFDPQVSWWPGDTETVEFREEVLRKVHRQRRVPSWR